MKRILPSLTVVGMVFIALGIICNEWMLVRLFAPEGVLSHTARILIWVLDLALISFGSLLIYFRRKARIQINLALLLGTLVVCLFAIEGVLRLIDLPREQQEGIEDIQNPISIFMQNPNGTGSYRLKPNLDIMVKVGSKDVAIKTNSLGMRWREVCYDNPMGKMRIAFVGDSQTFGCWADSIEDSFVGIFDSLLDSNKFETLNFGVGGYGLSDEELQIEEQILPFKPNYIVLAFFNGNDFRDTYLGKDRYDVTTGVAVLNMENLNSKIPKEFRTSAMEENTAGANSIASKFKSFISSLSIYKLLAQALNTLDANQTGGFSVSNQFTSYTFWSQVPYPEVAVKAKDLSLEVLDNIRELCYRNDIQLIIVALPYREEVYATSLSGSNYDINLPQKYVEEYSVTHSVPYLDLLPILRSYARETNSDICNYDGIHYSNEGHRVVGESIAKFFEETNADQSGDK